MLSAGVPLLLGGDELGRTQRGNNNAYCQDNEMTWFDWTAVALRRRHPVFRRRRYSTGKSASDLRWFTPSGAEMTAEDWSNASARSVALLIHGATDPDVGSDGTPMTDDDFLMLVNSWWEPLTFTVPDDLRSRRWDMACNSFEPAQKHTVAQNLTLGPRSVVVLQSSVSRPTNP
jgi:isoamylase